MSPVRYTAVLPYTPYSARMSPENTHKLMGIYMEGLILGVNTLYRLFCFFELFHVGCIGLTFVLYYQVWEAWERGYTKVLTKWANPFPAATSILLQTRCTGPQCLQGIPGLQRPEGRGAEGPVQWRGRRRGRGYPGTHKETECSCESYDTSQAHVGTLMPAVC